MPAMAWLRTGLLMYLPRESGHTVIQLEVCQEVRELGPADVLSPQSFSDIQIPVADLFA